MDKILKKQTLYLILSSAFALLLVVGIFIFLGTMRSKMSKVLEIKERIVTFEKNKKAFSEEAEKIKLLDSRLGTLESDIVTTETLPNLLSTFESLAKDQNIDFEITSVQTPTIDENTKLFIEFSANGSYTNLKNFLNETQHQVFQIKIPKLFLFAENLENTNQSASGTLSVKKITPSTKTAGWQSVGTIEILSF